MGEAVAPTRRWGDGLGKTRRHEIGFVSYADGMTGCAVDGEIVRFGPEGPEVAWDLHRGKQVSVEQYVIDKTAMATDAEVHEFLASLTSEDELTHSLAMASSAGLTRGEDAFLDSLAAAIERVLERQDECTCGTEPVAYCPNYMPGDEEDE